MGYTLTLALRRRRKRSRWRKHPPLAPPTVLFVLKLGILYMKKDQSVEQKYRDLKLYLQYV